MDSLSDSGAAVLITSAGGTDTFGIDLILSQGGHGERNRFFDPVSSPE